MVNNAESYDPLEILIYSIQEAGKRIVVDEVEDEEHPGTILLKYGKKEHNERYEFFKALFPKKTKNKSHVRYSPRGRVERLRVFKADNGLPEDCSTSMLAQMAMRITSPEEGNGAFSNVFDAKYYCYDGKQLFAHAVPAPLIEELAEAFSALGDNPYGVQMFREGARELWERSEEGESPEFAQKTLAFILLSLINGPGDYLGLFITPEETEPKYTPHRLNTPTPYAAPKTSLEGKWMLHQLEFPDKNSFIPSLTRIDYEYDMNDVICIGRGVDSPEGTKKLSFPNINPSSNSQMQISREHCLIANNGNGTWTVTDLESSFGTLILKRHETANAGELFFSPTLLKRIVKGRVMEQREAIVKPGDIIALAPFEDKESDTYYPQTTTGAAFSISRI